MTDIIVIDSEESLSLLIQTLVGHGDYAHIGFDCAEREIGRLGLSS